MKKIKKPVVKLNLPLAVNQDWTQTPCTLIGYDSQGILKVLGMYDFRDYGVIRAQLVNPTTITAISNKGQLLQFSIKPPSSRQPSFLITLTSQLSLGNWKSLVSSSVSPDGSSVLLMDFGGIRRYNKNGEYMNSADNDVIV